MASPQSTSSLDWRKALAAALIIAGVGIIALSFVWPGKSSRRGGWTDEQAKQYQAAAIKLHGLSHEIAHAKSDKQPAVRAELKKAEAEYGALRNDLETAMARPQRLAWILRLCGVVFVLGGGAILFMLPEPDSDPST